MKLSALILAKNEEEMIADCIKQLNFVDEMIVLDQNSEDKTAQIAKSLGAKVLDTKFPDFDKNRNLLKNEAKGEWLLYLDCDERVNNEVKDEIKNAILSAKYSGYYFPRKNFILGKFLKHGGWYPDYVPRLFKKDKLKEWKGQVHESPIIEGRFGYLKSPIDHFTARTVSSMFQKTISWAKIEADLAYYANHKSVNSLKVTKALFLEFATRYLVKLGFLDGTVGLIEAIFQSFHRAITLVYLWEKQNKTTDKITGFRNE